MLNCEFFQNVSIVVTSCGQGVRGLHGGDRRDRQRDLHPRRRGSLRHQHQPQSASGQLQPSLERSRTGTVGQRSTGSQLGWFIFGTAVKSGMNDPEQAGRDHRGLAHDAVVATLSVLTLSTGGQLRPPLE